MPVNSTNPFYDEQHPNWEKVRDAVAGEDAIKGKGEDYLPTPPGMTPGGNDLLDNGKRAGVERYQFYLSFAEFPEVISPALNGFQGIIHEKEPKITLPTKMEYLMEDSTPDSEPLSVLWQRMTREILSTGRVGLVCDVGSDDNVRIVSYAAESIINWRLRPVREGGDPDFVVVREAMEFPDEKDEFISETRQVFRELRMVSDGENGTPFYAVQTWIEPKDGGDPQPTAEGFVPVVRLAKPLDAVPIKVINAIDCGFDYGPIPIIPLVRRALSIYRLTADYRRALYIKGDPQPWIAGIEEEDAPTGIGGSAIWTFTDSTVKVDYLDVDGKGIPLTKEALDTEYERFHEEGGKLLSENDRGAESGEALRRRQVAKSVTLKGIVLNAADGLQSVLRKIAEMMGLDPEAVIFEPDVDFAEPTMSGKELFELMQAKNAGAVLSNKTIHDLARRGGLTEKDFDDEESEIAEEPAIVTGLMGITPIGAPEPNSDDKPAQESDDGEDDLEIDVDKEGK